jgi:hypothetical protein
MQKHPDKKKIWMRIDKDDHSITLADVADKIREIQQKHPDLDVFFDGDEFAICSRPIPTNEKKRKKTSFGFS